MVQTIYNSFRTIHITLHVRRYGVSIQFRIGISPPYSSCRALRATSCIEKTSSSAPPRRKAPDPTMSVATVNKFALLNGAFLPSRRYRSASGTSSRKKARQRSVVPAIFTQLIRPIVPNFPVFRALCR